MAILKTYPVGTKGTIVTVDDRGVINATGLNKTGGTSEYSDIQLCPHIRPTRKVIDDMQGGIRVIIGSVNEKPCSMPIILPAAYTPVIMAADKIATPIRKRIKDEKYQADKARDQAAEASAEEARKLADPQRMAIYNRARETGIRQLIETREVEMYQIDKGRHWCDVKIWAMPDGTHSREIIETHQSMVSRELDWRERMGEDYDC